MKFSVICGKISLVIAIKRKFTMAEKSEVAVQIGFPRGAGNFDGAMFGLNSGEKLQNVCWYAL